MGFSQITAVSAQPLYVEHVAKALNNDKTKKIVADKFKIDINDVYVLTDVEYRAQLDKYINKCCLITCNGKTHNKKDNDVSVYCKLPNSDKKLLLTTMELKGSISGLSQKQKELFCWIHNKMANLNEQQKERIVNCAIEEMKNSSSFKVLTGQVANKNRKKLEKWSEKEISEFLEKQKNAFYDVLDKIKKNKLKTEDVEDIYFENLVTQKDKDIYIMLVEKPCGLENITINNSLEFKYNGNPNDIVEEDLLTNKYKNLNHGTFANCEEHNKFTKLLPLTKKITSIFCEELKNGTLNESDKNKIIEIENQTNYPTFVRNEDVRDKKIYSDDPCRVAVIVQNVPYILEEKQKFGDLIDKTINSKMDNIEIVKQKTK